MILRLKCFFKFITPAFIEGSKFSKREALIHEINILSNKRHKLLVKMQQLQQVIASM